MKELGGSLLYLLLAIIQLVVGLGITAYAINSGLVLVSKLLSKDGSKFDIWEQVKAKNTAVAVLAAGVIVGYTRVIASGVESMSTAVGGLVGGNLTLWQGFSGLLAGVVNLVVAIAVASFAITVVFRIIDKLNVNLNEREELVGNNVAVGVIYAGILIGVASLVAAGVAGIGSGVNVVLHSLRNLV